MNLSFMRSTTRASGWAATAIAAIALIGGGAKQAQAQHYNNGLAATPALGWSSWSALRKGGISDSVIRAEADVMHAQLQSHGYQYINIDDGWYIDPAASVDQYGRLTPDPNKFPNGIKAVADYVHSLGLKFGIYEFPGIPIAAVNQNTPIAGTSYHAQDIVVKPYTREWPSGTGKENNVYTIDFSKPGAREYVQSCADQLASWGVDYVKLDWVNSTINISTDLPAWSTALKNTGRPIYLQLSNYLQVQPPYGAQYEAQSNAWRNNPDVETFNGNNPDGFNLPITDWAHITAPQRLANGQQSTNTGLAGPGGWNDEDSLEMGWSLANTGLTANEKQYMYAYWCITTSPLLLGSDLRNIDPTDLKTLQNDWVIDCDQAPYEPTYHHMANSNWQWYSKPSGDGGYYIMLDNVLNPADPGNPGTISVNFSSDLGLSGSQPVWDLFAGTSLGSSGSYSVSLPGHSAVLIKVGGNAPAGSPNGGGGTVGGGGGGTGGGTGGATIANGTYKIVNRNSGLALDDPNGASGSTIDQQPYGGVNQQWTVTASGAYYTIKNSAGLALTGGSQVQLAAASATGADNQLWSFTANGSYYLIKNKQTGQVADVYGGSSSAGATVGTWGIGKGGAGDVNQLWTLTAVTTGGGTGGSTGATKFNQGQYLAVNQYITSPSKNCFLIQQADGNLVLYKGSGPADNHGGIWASLTAAQPNGSYFTILQSDGNLVTYKGTGPADNHGGVWCNFTSGSNYLQITDSQQIQILSGTTVQWQKP